MKKLFTLHSTLRMNTGFTLVETLVAISILSISITATFTAVQNGIQNSTIAKDQTTAFYLAQEAMEFIKNKRDENALNSIAGGANQWLTGMSNVAEDQCYFGKTCTIDVTVSSNMFATCPGGFSACPRLNQQDTSLLFGHSTGAEWKPTIFRRGVQFLEIVPNKEVRVTIDMNWTSRWGEKSFQVTEILFNRQ